MVLVTNLSRQLKGSSLSLPGTGGTSLNDRQCTHSDLSTDSDLSTEWVYYFERSGNFVVALSKRLSCKRGVFSSRIQAEL